MVLKQLVIEILFLTFNYIPEYAVTVDAAARSEKNKFKMLLEFSENLLESGS